MFAFFPRESKTFSPKAVLSDRFPPSSSNSGRDCMEEHLKTSGFQIRRWHKKAKIIFFIFMFKNFNSFDQNFGVAVEAMS